MKNLASLVVATAISSSFVLVDAAVPDAPEVKLTPIKEENVPGAVKKLVESGFLKRAEKTGKYSKRPSRKSRALQRNKNGPLRRIGRERTLHQQTDDWYDDYFEYHDDDFLKPGKGGPHPDDDDYYVNPGDDDYYGKGGYDDDYYSGKGKGSKKSSKKSKKGKGGKGKGGKGKGGKGYYHRDDDDYYVMHGDDTPVVEPDDDFFGLGDDFFGLGDDLSFAEIPYEIEGFIDVRNVDPPIFADPTNPDFFAAGNVQLYVDTPMWEIDGIETSALIGLVQGTCTRTDPASEGDFDYEGSGVCSLTFEAIVGTEVVASFTAEGRVLNPNNSLGLQSILTVKGGLGEFQGVSGEILLYPATLDLDVNPPFPSIDDSLDFLDVMDGYIFEGVLFSTVAIDIFMEDDDTVDTPPTMGDMETVSCPGQPPENFCDCSGDCVNFPDTYCGCSEAQACCEDSVF